MTPVVCNATHLRLSQADRTFLRRPEAAIAPPPNVRRRILIALYMRSIMTPDQAKEFHEQFKVTYSAFVGLCAVAHLLVFASKPWF